MKKFDVVIIGGGPAGVSAAIWCKRLDLNHVLIEANDQLGGQLVEIYNEIIDYAGVMTKNGAELQELLVQQVDTVGCNVMLGCKINSIDSNKRYLHYTKEGKEEIISYQYLILATGAKPKRLEIPGEAEMFQRGEVYSATRDKERLSGKNVAVIGGGDRAVEGAFLLAEAGANVYLIHRTSHFRAKDSYKERAFANKNVQLLLNSNLIAIHGDQKVESIDVKSETGMKSITVDAVLIRIGVKPNSSLVREHINVDKDGFVVVNKVGLTNIPTIYAVGDLCTHPKYSSISNAVGQGMTCVKHIGHYLKEKV